MSAQRNPLGLVPTLAIATCSAEELRLIGSVENVTVQLVAIATLAEHALDSLAEGDPLRDDLGEVRAAARLAIARLDQLGASARQRPALRLVDD